MKSGEDSSFLKIKKMIAVSMAAFLASVIMLAAPSQSYGENSYDPNALAEEIVILVNQARAEAGLKPVKMVPYINDLAHVRCRELLVHLSHTRPDGTKFSSVFNQDVLPYSYCSENIGFGYETAQEVFEEWKSSEFHWGHVMDPDVTHTGVAFTYDENSECKWYWEELFVSMQREDSLVLPGEYIPVSHVIVPVSYGDLDGDGEVSTFDLITLIKYICGYVDFNDQQLKYADLLKDGDINISDAVILRKYILGVYRTLPMTIDMLLG